MLTAQVENQPVSNKFSDVLILLTFRTSLLFRVQVYKIQMEVTLVSYQHGSRTASFKGGPVMISAMWDGQKVPTN